jgi:formyltetrahydrofolate-dependent phosphoribosylglycinamide formyltransferase
MNVAVFASGGGSNFQALIDRVGSGDLHCSLSLCVGNNSAAVAFERAKKQGIPVCHIAPSHFSSDRGYADALLAELGRYRIDFIALAGYMKKIPLSVIAAYPYKIVNIHPGLLPAFGGKGLYGEKVHEAVIACGAKISGITIHFVDEEYDNGPIIFQEAVNVLDNDDSHQLAQRILKVEHANYWRVIEAIAQGRISVKGRRVYGPV